MTPLVQSQPLNAQSARHLSRKECLMLMFGAACGAVGLSSTASAATQSGTGVTTSFDITQAPFYADQSGGQDAAPAIQAALNAIMAIGRGKLIVPSGNYKLGSPLICNNASLTIVGDGQASSIWFVQHNGAALTVNCTSAGSSVTIRDIGLSPTPSAGAAGSALVLNFPNSTSGWQHCSIQDVDLGAPFPNYTSFMNGIVFTNLWRGNIRNVNMHSNIGNVPGSTFVTLNGTCVDNRFNNCSVDGINTGFFVGGYSEGLHISDTVIIGNVGVNTGTQPYSGNGSTSPLINVLGLYISGCEMNCNGNPLHLMYVDTGWVSDSHFGARNAATAAAIVLGCAKVQFLNCAFTGQFDKSNPQWDVGVLSGAASGWPSNNIMVDSCNFTNLLIGVQFGAGTFNSSARGVRMMAPGEGSLIGSPMLAGAFTMYACHDVSGNTTNSGQWLTSSTGVGTRDMKAQYLVP